MSQTESDSGPSQDEYFGPLGGEVGAMAQSLALVAVMPAAN